MQRQAEHVVHRRRRFAQGSGNSFSSSFVISSTIVVPRTLQATLMRRWRSSDRSKVRRFGFDGFTGGGETTFVAGVRSLTHSSLVVGRIGLLGNGAVFFAIKRDEFFGEGSYFLCCHGLGVGFTHDQTA
jgi:hypothetical protein